MSESILIIKKKIKNIKVSNTIGKYIMTYLLQSQKEKIFMDYC